LSGRGTERKASFKILIVYWLRADEATPSTAKQPCSLLITRPRSPSWQSHARHPLSVPARICVDALGR